jgi:hypothetical protein
MLAELRLPNADLATTAEIGAVGELGIDRPPRSTSIAELSAVAALPLRRA